MTAGAANTQLSPLVLSFRSEGSDRRNHLALPSPRTTLQHACPIVFEAVVAPVALFYLALVVTNFRGALLVALAWSYFALIRRLRGGKRISTLLLLGTTLLTARIVVAFVTGSTIVYFAQPMATAVGASLMLIGSAAIGRPFTQRFAHDFCPIDPELLARPRVHRFFVRISLLWAVILLLNAGIVLWLLLSTSLRAFVLERAAVTLSLTALAIFLSVTRFVAAMRNDGITVEWGRYHQPRPAEESL